MKIDYFADTDTLYIEFLDLPVSETRDMGDEAIWRQSGAASIVSVMPIPLPAQAPPIREADGALRVGETGVTLETVLWAFQQGATPDDIQRQFPSLDLADIYDVIAHYLRHREAVEEYLREREQAYRETIEELKKEFPQDDLRARLLGRRKR
jgi:uncharacterized protein (DUF433 family)